MSKRIRPIIICIFALAVTLLTGCSAFTMEKEETAMPTKVKKVSSTKAMTDGTYYVMHTNEEGEKEYYETYVYDFANKSNPYTVFFHKDWEAVPTLYEGDSLVLRTSSELPATFNLIRYLDEGYTFGFCGMKPDDAGRYCIDTNKAEGISRLSSASQLLKLYSSSTVLDSVGGSALKAGNFSIGGTVLGLQKDQQYSCVFYTGSIRHDFKLTADTVALSEWEKMKVDSSTFIEGDLVKINLPSDMNSGYYSCHGSGVFRYVKGTSYSANTDFNIPNLVVEEKTEGEESLPNNTQDETDDTEKEKKDVVVYTLTVDTDNPRTIHITYDDPIVPDDTLKDPVVKIVGSEFVLTMTKTEEENSFDETIKLPLGRYSIEIEGLAGRTPHVLVS